MIWLTRQDFEDDPERNPALVFQGQFRTEAVERFMADEGIILPAGRRLRVSSWYVCERHEFGAVYYDEVPVNSRGGGWITLARMVSLVEMEGAHA